MSSAAATAQFPSSEQIAERRVLLVEDDAELAGFLQQALRTFGYTVGVVTSCATARATLDATSWDVIVLDRMLDDGDGLDVLGDLRAAGRFVPTIVVSALGESSHRILGLRNGADDYMTKPFDCDELIARIEALLRRSAGRSENHLQVRELRIDPEKRVVYRGDIEIRLQPREYDLLLYFAKHAGDVVTRAMLLKDVWGFDFDPQTNVVDVHVSRLRSKLDRGQETKLIETVRGKGYRMVA